MAASAFIGSYWSVYDRSALHFARALYDGLIGGASIGRVVKAARTAVREAGDPLTCLAYTVYADPGATVESR